MIVLGDHHHVVFNGAVAEVGDFFVDRVINGIFVVDAGASDEQRKINSKMFDIVFISSIFHLLVASEHLNARRCAKENGRLAAIEYLQKALSLHDVGLAVDEIEDDVINDGT